MPITSATSIRIATPGSIHHSSSSSSISSSRSRSHSQSSNNSNRSCRSRCTVAGGGGGSRRSSRSYIRSDIIGRKKEEKASSFRLDDSDTTLSKPFLFNVKCLYRGEEEERKGSPNDPHSSQKESGDGHHHHHHHHHHRDSNVDAVLSTADQIDLAIRQIRQFEKDAGDSDGDGWGTDEASSCSFSSSSAPQPSLLSHDTTIAATNSDADRDDAGGRVNIGTDDVDGDDDKDGDAILESDEKDTSPKANAPTGRCCHTMVSVDDRYLIIAFGGSTEESFGDCYVFDTMWGVKGVEICASSPSSSSLSRAAAGKNIGGGSSINNSSSGSSSRSGMDPAVASVSLHPAVSVRNAAASTTVARNCQQHVIARLVPTCCPIHQPTAADDCRRESLHSHIKAQTSTAKTEREAPPLCQCHNHHKQQHHQHQHFAEALSVCYQNFVERQQQSHRKEEQKQNDATPPTPITIPFACPSLRWTRFPGVLTNGCEVPKRTSHSAILKRGGPCGYLGSDLTPSTSSSSVSSSLIASPHSKTFPLPPSIAEMLPSSQFDTRGGGKDLVIPFLNDSYLVVFGGNVTTTSYTTPSRARDNVQTFDNDDDDACQEDADVGNDILQINASAMVRYHEARVARMLLKMAAASRSSADDDVPSRLSLPLPPLPQLPPMPRWVCVQPFILETQGRVGEMPLPSMLTESCRRQTSHTCHQEEEEKKGVVAQATNEVHQSLRSCGRERQQERVARRQRRNKRSGDASSSLSSASEGEEAFLPHNIYADEALFSHYLQLHYSRLVMGSEGLWEAVKAFVDAAEKKKAARREKEEKATQARERGRGGRGAADGSSAQSSQRVGREALFASSPSPTPLMPSDLPSFASLLLFGRRGLRKGEEDGDDADRAAHVAQLTSSSLSSSPHHAAAIDGNNNHDDNHNSLIPLPLLPPRFDVSSVERFQVPKQRGLHSAVIHNLEDAVETLLLLPSSTRNQQGRRREEEKKKKEAKNNGNSSDSRDAKNTTSTTINSTNKKNIPSPSVPHMFVLDGWGPNRCVYNDFWALNLVSLQWSRIPFVGAHPTHPCAASTPQSALQSMPMTMNVLSTHQLRKRQHLEKSRLDLLNQQRVLSLQLGATMEAQYTTLAAEEHARQQQRLMFEERRREAEEKRSKKMTMLMERRRETARPHDTLRVNDDDDDDDDDDVAAAADGDDDGDNATATASSSSPFVSHQPTAASPFLPFSAPALSSLSSPFAPSSPSSPLFDGSHHCQRQTHQQTQYQQRQQSHPPLPPLPNDMLASAIAQPFQLYLQYLRRLRGGGGGNGGEGSVSSSLSAAQSVHDSIFSSNPTATLLYFSNSLASHRRHMAVITERYNAAVRAAAQSEVMRQLNPRGCPRGALCGHSAVVYGGCMYVFGGSRLTNAAVVVGPAGGAAEGRSPLSLLSSSISSSPTAALGIVIPSSMFDPDPHNGHQSGTLFPPPPSASSSLPPSPTQQRQQPRPTPSVCVADYSNDLHRFDFSTFLWSEVVGAPTPTATTTANTNNTAFAFSSSSSSSSPPPPPPTTATVRWRGSSPFASGPSSSTCVDAEDDEEDHHCVSATVNTILANNNLKKNASRRAERKQRRDGQHQHQHHQPTTHWNRALASRPSFFSSFFDDIAAKQRHQKQQQQQQQQQHQQQQLVGQNIAPLSPQQPSLPSLPLRLPAPRYSASLAAWGGALYLFGGDSHGCGRYYGDLWRLGIEDDEDKKEDCADDSNVDLVVKSSGGDARRRCGDDDVGGKCIHPMLYCGDDDERGGGVVNGGIVVTRVVAGGNRWHRLDTLMTASSLAPPSSPPPFSSSFSSPSPPPPRRPAYILAESVDGGGLGLVNSGGDDAEEEGKGGEADDHLPLISEHGHCERSTSSISMMKRSVAAAVNQQQPQEEEGNASTTTVHQQERQEKEDTSQYYDHSPSSTTSTSSQQQQAMFPCHRSGQTMVAVNGTLFIFGGEHPTRGAKEEQKEEEEEDEDSSSASSSSSSSSSSSPVDSSVTTLSDVYAITIGIGSAATSSPPSHHRDRHGHPLSSSNSFSLAQMAARWLSCSILSRKAIAVVVNADHNANDERKESDTVCNGSKRLPLRLRYQCEGVGTMVRSPLGIEATARLARKKSPSSSFGDCNVSASSLMSRLLLGLFSSSSTPSRSAFAFSFRFASLLLCDRLKEQEEKVEGTTNNGEEKKAEAFVGNIKQQRTQGLSALASSSSFTSLPFCSTSAAGVTSLLAYEAAGCTCGGAVW